jgi:hypothetical protein
MQMLSPAEVQLTSCEIKHRGLSWRLLLPAVCTLCSVLGCNADSRGDLAGNPIVIGSDVADLGVVRPGELLATTFEIHNPFESRIEFLRFVRSCDCLEPTISRRLLEPNETAEIVVSLAAPAASQDFRQSLDCIFTLDTGEKRLSHFEIAAMVRESLSVSSNYVTWELYDEAELLPQVIAVSNYSEIMREGPKIEFSDQQFELVGFHEISALRGALQSWAIEILPAMNTGKDGGSGSQVAISLLGADESQIVKLSTRKLQLFELLPASIFVDASGDREGALLLVWRGPTPPISSAGFVIEIPVIGGLELDIEQVSSGRYKLNYKAADCDISYNGKLLVRAVGYQAGIEVPFHVQPVKK